MRKAINRSRAAIAAFVLPRHYAAMRVDGLGSGEIQIAVEPRDFDMTVVVGFRPLRSRFGTVWNLRRPDACRLRDLLIRALGAP